MVNVDGDYLAWLEWFEANADFGPASDDVMDIMQEEFTAETGIILPGWEDVEK